MLGGGSPVLPALVLEVVHVAALGGVHRVLGLAVLGQGVTSGDSGNEKDEKVTAGHLSVIYGYQVAGVFHHELALAKAPHSLRIVDMKQRSQALVPY